MDSWNALSEQLPALARGKCDSVLLDCFLIILNAFEAGDDRLGDVRSADSGESQDLGVVCYGHDPWDYRDRHALLAHSFLEGEEVAVVEEELGDYDVASSHDLLAEMIPIFLSTRRFRVSFGVTRDGDAEWIRGADEPGQLAGVFESLGIRLETGFSLWGVTPQGNYVLYS